MLTRFPPSLFGVALCLFFLFGTFVTAVNAGQGAQRLLFTSPNSTFVMQKTGEVLVNVNDTSGSIETLRTAINNARTANPNSIIVIRLANSMSYVVTGTS